MTLKSQRKYSVAWIDPDFHKLLKVRSAEEDLSIVDFTRKLAQDHQRQNNSQTQQVQGLKPRRKFNFESF